MSRLTKPAPLGCHSKRVEGDYEICARCGEILCSAERVEVVYRGDRGTWRKYVSPSGPDWYGIYTHPEGPPCGRGTAAGWSAIERAIDRREFNRPTPRQSLPVVLCDYVFPFVSLLDNKQLELECGAVSYYGEEFPLSQLRKKWSAEGDPEDEKPYLVEYDIKFAHQCSRAREETYIRLVDRYALGHWAVLDRRVTQKARERLFVIRSWHFLMQIGPFEFYFPGRDKRFVLERRLGNVTESLASEQWAKALQGVTQGSALLSTDNGEAVEYALYSRCSVVSTHKGKAFPNPSPPAKAPTDVDFDEERAALIRIAQRAGVSQSNIGKALRFSSNLSLAQEIGKEDSKSKTLTLGELDQLAVYRLTPRAKPVPVSFDSRQFPEHYHWKVPETDFRCPHCGMSFELVCEYCSACGERIALEERVKAVLDSAVRDLAKDPTSLYEPCATLRVNSLNALNKNFLPDSQNLCTTGQLISTLAKDAPSYRGLEVVPRK